MKPVYNYGTSLKKICSNIGINTSSGYLLTKDDHKKIIDYLSRGGHGIPLNIANLFIYMSQGIYSGGLSYGGNAKDFAGQTYEKSLRDFGINTSNRSESDWINDARILSDIFGNEYQNSDSSKVNNNDNSNKKSKPNKQLKEEFNIKSSKETAKYYYDNKYDSIIGLLFSYKGRLNRKIYIITIVPVILLIACIVLLIYGRNKYIGPNDGINMTGIIFICLLLYISIVLIIKRMHDIDSLVWDNLFIFAFFYITIPVLMFYPGTNGDNKFGPPPKNKFLFYI